MNIYNNIIKRSIDFLFALVCLFALLPLFFLLAIAIKIDSRGPVFYRALRGGYRDIPFEIFKFRTMIVNADKIGGSTTALNDSRITKVGKTLRKTKLDEIPQLINIIKGDMSFVGPRPEILAYTSKYTPEEKRILSVRPGITDISSLKYISLDEVVGSLNADEYYEKYVFHDKNRLRLEYVDKQSFLLDARLFLKTALKVVRQVVKIFV
ncbi:MAG: sugar transferase [Tannerellaceae bacterium]|jgi:lipopolysaccharide/colanic/teichoic acid biosynthesis glycosyltransferase|nr:sugar transferase [Tannerellaceae bacterium]